MVIQQHGDSKTQGDCQCHQLVLAISPCSGTPACWLATTPPANIPACSLARHSVVQGESCEHPGSALFHKRRFWGAMLLKSGVFVYIFVYIKHALYLKYHYFSNGYEQ